MKELKLGGPIHILVSSDSSTVDDSQDLVVRCAARAEAYRVARNMMIVPGYPGIDIVTKRCIQLDVHQQQSCNACGVERDLQVSPVC